MKTKIDTLANGLKVVSVENPHSNTVFITILVKTGSRNETKEQAGISHLIEHMVFKGTKSRSAIQINQAIENIGGELNAMTDTEKTGFTVDLMAGDLEIGVDVLSDLILNPTFLEKELKLEKNVVIQEIKNYLDDKMAQVDRNFNVTAYANRFFDWDITGYIKTVKSISADDLREYMQKYYVANNMVICAAGNFKHEDLMVLSEKYLGSMPSGIVPESPELIYTGGFRNLRDEAESLELTFGFNADKFRNNYASAILSNVLGFGCCSRLFVQTRERKGLTYDINANLDIGRDSGIFMVSSNSSIKNLNKIIDVICKETKEIATELISDEELMRAKKIIISQLLRSFDNNEEVCIGYAKTVLTYGCYSPIENKIAKINAVTKEDVLQVAKDIFSSPLTYCVYGKAEKIYSYGEVLEKLKF